MAAQKPHSTRAWTSLARKRIAQAEAAQEPCGLCGQAIDYGLRGKNVRGAPTADHMLPLSLGGSLTPPLEELRVVHKSCNSRQGAALSRGRHPAGRQRSGRTGPGSDTPGGSSGGPVPAPAPFAGLPTPGGYAPGSGDEAGRSVDVPAVWAGVPWVSDLLPVPEEATWPAVMSEPHPRATGSLGPEAEAWVAEHMGVRLRWWQRLAFRRCLEVDDEGHLVWATVAESTPRRSGKSVRLRAQATWRIHQAERFGETQLAMLTAKDMQVAKEVMRPAMAWASGLGYRVLRGNGTDAIEHPDGSRWLMRGQDSVYGYDIGLGMVDEAWSVRPSVVDDGLEPALLERLEPQLVLTSTAHRRATGLMPGRMRQGSGTLVLYWGAGQGSDVADRGAWRAASPHWSEARAMLLARVLERVASGAAEPDPDEPDPVEAFRAQYLNVWPEDRLGAPEWLPKALVEGRGSLRGPRGPVAGALEVSLDGRTWAAAVADGEVADVALALTLPQALAWLRERAPLLVLVHPAAASQVGESTGLVLRNVSVGEQVAATRTLADAVRGGTVAWRAPAGLAAEFARVVVVGGRVSATRSLGPVAGVQALAWAHWWASVEGAEGPQVF